MATRFRGSPDVEGLDDAELQELIRETLAEYPNVDSDWVEVDVEDGFVTLSGRLGTEEEVQVAETVVRDILGIESMESELLVDELHREERPVDPVQSAAEDERVDAQLGEGDPDHSESSSHLDEDLEAEAFGTHDARESAEKGVPYAPPDRPVADGYRSREDH